MYVCTWVCMAVSSWWFPHDLAMNRAYFSDFSWTGHTFGTLYQTRCSKGNTGSHSGSLAVETWCIHWFVKHLTSWSAWPSNPCISQKAAQTYFCKKTSSASWIENGYYCLLLSWISTRLMCWIMHDFICRYIFPDNCYWICNLKQSRKEWKCKSRSLEIQSNLALHGQQAILMLKFAVWIV